MWGVGVWERSASRATKVEVDDRAFRSVDDCLGCLWHQKTIVHRCFYTSQLLVHVILLSFIYRPIARNVVASGAKIHKNPHLTAIITKKTIY